MRGQTNHPDYKLWAAMRSRCENPNHASYHHYGGRGIKVCERWSIFDHFLADMGPRPEGMSLDRINNDGDYEPGNCRWASQKMQASNSRRNHRITVNGEILTVTQAAEKYGVTVSAIQWRIAHGWSEQEAATTPCDKRKYYHGAANKCAKLTDAAVTDIRSRSATTAQLAKEYGVSPSLVGLVRARKIWKHLP